MNSIELVGAHLRHVRATTRQVLEGVTAAELDYRPGLSANPIGFMLWHLARTEDRWLHRFIPGRGDEIATAQGWAARLPVVPPEGTRGWGTAGGGWSAEQVAGFPRLDRDALVGYLEAVRDDLLSYARGLGEDELDVKPRPDTSDLTIGWVLRQLIIHEAAHAGQIDFALGLKEGKVRS